VFNISPEDDDDELPFRVLEEEAEAAQHSYNPFAAAGQKGAMNV